MEDRKLLPSTTKMARMMIGWKVIVFAVANDDDDDGNFTYHSSDGLDENDENGNEVLGYGTDGTSPKQCLHVTTMVRVSMGDIWTTCQNGCMKLKQITHLMQNFFLPPPSPRFFHVSHARISTTQQYGFTFYCGRQAIPHGRGLTKTSAK
jgi:hypothetical protein